MPRSQTSKSREVNEIGVSIAVEIGDLTGDSRPDLIVTGRGRNGMSVLVNLGGGGDLDLNETMPKTTNRTGLVGLVLDSLCSFWLYSVRRRSSAEI